MLLFWHLQSICTGELTLVILFQLDTNCKVNEVSDAISSSICLPMTCSAFRLSTQVLKSRRLADLATLLFMWNPASVFYSAAYTESIFSSTTFIGLCYLESHPWTATFWFCAASATRSNGQHAAKSGKCSKTAGIPAMSLCCAGILHCWYVVHRLLRGVTQESSTKLWVCCEVSCLETDAFLLNHSCVSFSANPDC